MPENNDLKARKKPTQERSKATVDAIYEAALQLLLKDNYDVVTTDRIAERAGVSIGTLYQYFPNKESILVGMWEQVFNAVIVGGITYPLHQPGMAGEVKAPESHESIADGNQDADRNVMKHIAGVYAGVLSGTSEGSIFHLKHRFKVHGTWKVDLGETTLKLLIKGLPIIDRVTGAGTVDPRTGFMKMVSKVPIFGNLRGSGRLNGSNFSFHIPLVNFFISGTIYADGSASGVWKFNFSVIVLKLSGEGDLSVAYQPGRASPDAQGHL